MQVRKNIYIEGLRVEIADKDPSYTEEGIPEILAGGKAVIRLFGSGIIEGTLITFTDMPQERDSICDKIKSNEFQVRESYYLHTKINSKLIKSI